MGGKRFEGRGGRDKGRARGEDEGVEAWRAKSKGSDGAVMAHEHTSRGPGSAHGQTHTVRRLGHAQRYGRSGPVSEATVYAIVTLANRYKSHVYSVLLVLRTWQGFGQYINSLLWVVAAFDANLAIMILYKLADPMPVDRYMLGSFMELWVLRHCNRSIIIAPDQRW